MYIDIGLYIAAEEQSFKLAKWATDGYGFCGNCNFAL